MMIIVRVLLIGKQAAGKPHAFASKTPHQQEFKIYSIGIL